MCLRNIFDYSLDFCDDYNIRKAALLSPLIGECLSVFLLWYVRRGVVSEVTNNIWTYRGHFDR